MAVSDLSLSVWDLRYAIRPPSGAHCTCRKRSPRAAWRSFRGLSPGRAPSDQRHKENPTARAAIASAAMTRAGLLRCPGTRARLLED
jgi:hypothetical protein